jgi:hypothetical protein
LPKNPAKGGIPAIENKKRRKEKDHKRLIRKKLLKFDK